MGVAHDVLRFFQSLCDDHFRPGCVLRGAFRFELLEQLSQHQETAYERLYRWVQDRCQTLEEETPAADVTLQVRQSVSRPCFGRVWSAGMDVLLVFLAVFFS